MSMIAGIICEYNPFHNGHLLQMQQLREEKGAEVILCVMGGHFLQRGEPSLLEKERRVMMALSCGADLVIELPALYACRSAYWFALGGVSLLAAAGATHLAFGAETDALPDLLATASRLVQPDPTYQDALRQALNAGLSYAEAQTKALNSGTHREFVPVLPNDRLALSYLRIIIEKGFPMRPILIPRQGSGFLDPDLSGDSSLPASATAIRQRLAECVQSGGGRQLSLSQLMDAGLNAYIPEQALPFLADTPLVFPADAYPIQLALFRRAALDSLAELPDMTEGLEYRVFHAAGRSSSMEEFYTLLRTRRYTLTRLQRMAAHLLIDYRQSHAVLLREGLPYLRILGMNPRGQQHLHSIRKDITIPIVTRTSQMKAATKTSSIAAVSWELELRATAIHSLLSGRDFSKGNPEYYFSTRVIQN